VNEFRCPDGSDPSTEAGRKRIAEQYAAALAAERIDLAAITDTTAFTKTGSTLSGKPPANVG
jgi:hypothetical protein